jgi:hypothetical protein
VELRKEPAGHDVGRALAHPMDRSIAPVDPEVARARSPNPSSSRSPANEDAVGRFDARPVVDAEACTAKPAMPGWRMLVVDDKKSEVENVGVPPDVGAEYANSRGDPYSTATPDLFGELPPRSADAKTASPMPSPSTSPMARLLPSLVSSPPARCDADDPKTRRFAADDVSSEVVDDMALPPLKANRAPALATLPQPTPATALVHPAWVGAVTSRSATPSPSRSPTAASLPNEGWAVAGMVAEGASYTTRRPDVPSDETSMVLDTFESDATPNTTATPLDEDDPVVWFQHARSSMPSPLRSFFLGPAPCAHRLTPRMVHRGRDASCDADVTPSSYSEAVPRITLQPELGDAEHATMSGTPSLLTSTPPVTLDPRPCPATPESILDPHPPETTLDRSRLPPSACAHVPVGLPYRTYTDPALAAPPRDDPGAPMATSEKPSPLTSPIALAETAPTSAVGPDTASPPSWYEGSAGTAGAEDLGVRSAYSAETSAADRARL